MSPREELFPGLRSKFYFNYGGQGVMSESTLGAIIDAYRFVQSEGPFSTSMVGWIRDQLNDTRAKLANRFGGKAFLYALTQNVTEACNIALWGLSWKPGDEIMISDAEHHGVRDAVHNLAQRFELTVAEIALSKLDGKALEAEMAQKLNKDGRTRIFVFSHVLWNSGKVVDLPTIVEFCRNNNVFTLVDGAQSAGVLPLDVEASSVDFYAFTGHKWLCGPEGTGALYICEDLIDQIRPTYMGWRHHLQGAVKGAEKFEIATSSYPLLAGFREALTVPERLAGDSERYEKIIALAKQLKNRLEDNQFKVVPGAGQSGLLSFYVPDYAAEDNLDPGKITNLDNLVKTLEERKIYLRSIPEPRCLRVSLHYLSEQSDIDYLLSELQTLCKSQELTL
jgi:L-cysteine/cystine lyase